MNGLRKPIFTHRDFSIHAPWFLKSRTMIFKITQRDFSIHAASFPESRSINHFSVGRECLQFYRCKYISHHTLQYIQLRQTHIVVYMKNSKSCKNHQFLYDFLPKISKNIELQYINFLKNSTFSHKSKVGNFEILCHYYIVRR